MINIKANHECCGCHACYNACPQKCITMLEDTEGFWYPQINQDKCIKCNLCKKICPIVKKNKVSSLLEVYACINRDEEIRLKSSSGAIFTILAEHVIAKGGSVFGAGFNDKFEVIHQEACGKEELEKLRGSKYVQSKIGNTYIKTKEILDSHKFVLFTGTPCQVAGLKSFLGKDYEKLLCIDIICHGVPSPLVWEKYVEFRSNSKKIKKISFREKNEGWNLSSLAFKFHDNTEYKMNHRKDIYMKGFLKDLYLRPSCYQCSFKSKARQSDFTLADFWGVNQFFPEMDDDKGTSLVVIHSQKAKILFNEIKSNMFYLKVSMEQAIKYNPSMIKSVKLNKNRKRFFETLQGKQYLSIEELIDKYTKITFEEKIWNLVRWFLGGIKRRILAFLK